jgi:hypothetical protein
MACSSWKPESFQSKVGDLHAEGLDLGEALLDVLVGDEKIPYSD